MLLTGQFNLFDKPLYGNNIFSSAGEMEVSITANIYRLLMKIGIWGVLISLILCGISFLVHSSDPRKREENKNWLLRIGLSATAIFGFMSAMGMILTFLESF